MDGNRFFLSVLILALTAAGYYLKYFYAYAIFGAARYQEIDSNVRGLLIDATAVLMCLVFTFLVSSFSFKRMFRMLGMRKHFLIPVAVAFVCTLPMFIGGFFMSPVREEAGPAYIFAAALWPGFSEELIYRAFATGLLVRVASWHFLPAALISSFLFGYGHLYQAADFTQAILILLLTVGAGLGFSVFYRMWNWNLWFIASLHIFMNLSFVVFDTGDNALLTPAANIFRGLTILLAIIATVVYQRQQKRHAKDTVPLVVAPKA